MKGWHNGNTLRNTFSRYRKLELNTLNYETGHGLCLNFQAALLISLDTQENKKLSENKSYEDERISVDP